MRSLPPPDSPHRPEPLGNRPLALRRIQGAKSRIATGLAFLALCFAANADLYVSPNGSDDQPGSVTQPLATPERARDLMRELRATGKIPADGLTIWLRGGDYARTNTLELTSADSGTADAPMQWRAYRDEKVRWLGGARLTGFHPVDDPSVSARLAAAARSHILQIDLLKLNLRAEGELKSRGFGRSTTPAHNELFFANRPMTLARWPNTGEWTRIDGFPEKAGQGDDHGGTIGGLTGGFHYRGERPREWSNVANVWVHGYWAYDWANSYEKVASLDPQTRLIQTAPPNGLYGFRKGQRFYFLNVLEELDQPGEWFLDRKNQRLYFWPPADPDPGNTLLSLLDRPFLQLNDASHVVIRGIDFEIARGSGIEISGGEGNRVLGCSLKNLGNWGVIIRGGTDHGVDSCNIFDTGDGGVSLTGGDRQNLTPGGHFVENCHFQRQGRWSKCYVPAISMTGVGLRASHNLIHDHPHCAILFGGNDHLIEFNDIHHIALETGDVGAIYTGRDYTFRGNRIRHNYIHETGGVGMGSMGVYMDDCVSGTEIFGNIFYKVHWAMFIGGGRDHRVENNVFVDCDPAIRADGRGLDRSPVWRNMVDRTMRERLNKVPLDLYRARYPAMQSLDAHYGPPDGAALEGDAFKGVPPEGNVIARNFCVGKWTEITWHAKPEWFDIRSNHVTSDHAELVGSGATLQPTPESPIWTMGFQPIPGEQIGLRSPPGRVH